MVAATTIQEGSPIPLKGIAVPPDVRTELEAVMENLRKDIDRLKSDLKGRPALLDHLPNVQFLHKAVAVALSDDDLHDPKEFDLARGQLREGHLRRLGDGSLGPEQRARGNSHDRRVRRNVLGDHRAGADGCPVANVNLGQHHASESEEDAFADRGSAGQVGNRNM